MKLLQKAIADGSFVLDLKAHDIESILHQTLNHVVARGQLAAERRDEVERALLKREQEAPTAIGHAVAVPHVYLDVFDAPMIVFVRLAHPLNLGAPDGIPTRFLFVLLGPPGGAAAHLDTLASIARLTSDDEFRYEAGMARNGSELLEALRTFHERSAPPEAFARPKIPEGLQYTGRWFGGVVNDLKRRIPRYQSDFLDGLHSKSVSSTLFLFFACLAPAVTFGGIMAELTDSHIGAVEMIVASAFCGVVYALFAGQPLIILGGTGPLLIFTWMLYGLCQDLEIDFLATRMWIGLWTAGLLLLLAATDASCLMRYFTRFTDEIFAALISIIFIYAAIEALVHVCLEVYGEPTTSHDRALVPLLLAIGTFYVATALSRFRRSRYLLAGIREFLADFGPTIALVSMILVAVGWFHDVEFKTLPAPDAVQPTIQRTWLIDPLAAPRWVWLAALGPAILVTTLIFMDQNITARLVNSPDHKLQKGDSYHLDLAVMGVLIGVCSVFGLPWLVAATVRSLNHVRSLATLEEVVMGTGETRERVIHVRETRVTGLGIHLLIACSLLLLPLLKIIPMSVLYGLFLFMGVASIAGNQFFERLNLWLTDSSLYPATHYTRTVPMPIIHAFTGLQVICLVALIVVEVSPVGILFPLCIALLVPVRFLAGRYFREEHLAALDAEEDPEGEENQWV